MISIVLTIFNQQDILPMVLDGIFKNSSPLVKEVVYVLDGCTDNSEIILLRYLLFHSFSKTRILYANNVFETKANNIGLRQCSEPYVVIVQDDMVIQEKDWDKRLLDPILKYEDIFAVTSRTAHDNVINDGKLCFVNMAGREVGTPRNIFAIRDSVNRGPLLIRHDVLEQMDYLDEIYAPQGFDEHDLCYRAYASGGWKAGVYTIGYKSELEWGSSRKASAGIVMEAFNHNRDFFVQRHYKALIGSKHSEDRVMYE